MTTPRRRNGLPSASTPDRARRTPRAVRPCVVEGLESRQLLSTFQVTSLGDSGPGSLRRAILAANATPGPDTIDFAVAGTIAVGRTSLPAITSRVDIDGTTAPGFTGTPRVTLDFRGSKGLQFNRGSDGSSLTSLALVRSGCSGVTLRGSNITLQDNDIGVLADGSTAAPNRGDGVTIVASSHGNIIGRENPLSSVSYFNAAAVSLQPVSAWQGIRGADTPGQYLITGTSGPNGLLFVGTIAGQGTSYAVNDPLAASTSVYGPDNLGNGALRLVGSYKTSTAATDPVAVHGFVFDGTTADLPSGGSYRTIDYPGARFNYVHSTMNGLAVGNADGPTSSGQPIGPGVAYIYDVARSTFLTNVSYPGSVSDTAYGIWSNGKGQYTICGGYSDASVNNVHDQNQPIGQAYLVDYNAITDQFSNWTSFSYPNGGPGKDFVTHFEGISGVEKGVYTLNADSVQAGTTNPVQGSVVTVRRNADGSFGQPLWVDLNDPSTPGVDSSNSIYGNQVVGVTFGPDGASSYQATVNTAFQPSNVISANLGNGVAIDGSNGNVVAMNLIGTDASGNVPLGNAQNGVLVTGHAVGNLIGGQSTGGNDPTAGVFARPPLGNLISANGRNGVLINQDSTRTVLSGNFIGTAASGSAPLGNRLDGVSIDHADGNSLIGCNVQQDPFVYYNVVSGNGGNGLHINSSNNTTVQANFLGAGADNATVVPNRGDGLLVSGTSTNTQVGGVIPLGNVISGNDRNGIEVRDRARGFTSFNTFAGIFAFGGAAPNRLDGTLITSTGGDNLIRTCIISGNLGNGIEIGGNATGVQVTETAVGTNTSINAAIPNGGSGIVLTGRAHGNAIGGFQPSVEPQVTTSSNAGYGIAVLGHAHDNAIFHTYIGTNFKGDAPLGNALGGILLGPGSSSTTIGGAADPMQVRIADNLGVGLTILSSRHNTVLNDLIRHNTGDGILLVGALDNRIGTPLAGNTLAANLAYGLTAVGDCTGTLLQNNTLAANASGNLNLTRSRGIRLVPTP